MRRVRLRSVALGCAALVWTGCGYIASPLPPLANIPSRVNDLSATERGDRLIVQFTVPQLTTEGVEIRPPVALDLRVGPALNPWNERQWEEQGRAIPEAFASPAGQGPAPGTPAHYQVPAGEWIGKQVAIAVRTSGANGKLSGWSNFANVAVIAPPERPRDVKGEVTHAGLRLTWQARGEHFRVLRAAGKSERFDVVAADVTKPEWTDPAIQFGTPYRYVVQTYVPQGPGREAQSELSETYAITPEPIAPVAPGGLRAVAAPASVELSWDGNPEPDIAGYRIYRGEAGGPLQRIGESGMVPAYSDKTVEHGRTYRYAVSAVGGSGKEGAQSAAVEIAYP